MGESNGRNNGKHPIVKWATIAVMLLMLAANFYLEVQEQFRHDEVLSNRRFEKIERRLGELEAQQEMLKDWTFNNGM